MTSPDPSPLKPRLQRSASERRIAGVAGGVAQHFGLDPALVRIAFAVLAFFGGAGLALYALGAFIIPPEPGAPPLTRREQAVIGVIALAALLSVPVSGGAVLVLLVPAAIGVLVWRAFGGRADPRLVRASLIVVGIVAASVVGLAAAAGAALGGGTVVAVLVIASGLALVAAGLRGGGRWLIVPALLLALPASVVSAADLRLEGGVGDRFYRPASVSELQPAYRLGAGYLRLDLRSLRLEPGSEVDVTARVGLGRLEVTVPRGVCVRADAHVGMGDIDLLGRVNNGVDVDGQRGGDPDATQPVLRLHLRGSAAALRVDRRPSRDRNGPLMSDGCAG